VQGGYFPALIWKAFMDPAHTWLPAVDWDRPAPPDRPNARLYLPGNECVLKVVGFQEVLPEVDPNAPPTVATTLAPGEVPAETVPPVTIPITESVQVGTTIPPDNLDPNAPVPFLPLTDLVGPCA
jgi:penicillin-binding protein 1A